MNLGIVGVTGMVVQTFLKVLEDKNLPVDNYFFFASKRSAGKAITFKGKEYTVIELNKDITGYDLDIALFSAGGDISREFVPLLSSSGCIVVDNSSVFRMQDDVPLVVPEVNKHEISNHNGIIANPNCSTIQAVVALKPLDDKYKIKRVVYSTYQSVSGAGMKGVTDLERGAKGEPPSNFAHQIFGNCLPHIDTFLETGYTKEEQKMIDETKKILGNQDLKITATTVRVPVFVGHSESINIEFHNDFDLDDVIATLKSSPSIIVADDPKNNLYPMAITAAGKDEVFVGRIRRDYSIDNGLNIWVVSDNVRKGAATNAVQIAEVIIQEKAKN